MKVDHAVPIVPVVEDDRNLLHAAGLAERQGVEQLVERAEAAGEDDQRLRPQQEVHLAQREVVELEAQLRRDVGIGHLLGGELDVEADRFRAGVVGAAVGGLHDARSAAGDDHVIADVIDLASGRDEPAELAGRVVMLGHRQQTLAAADLTG